MKKINIKSSAGLWDSFMKMASLEDEYYDRELCRQICDQLGIKNDDVLTELKKKKVSVEELLKAIFKSMEPFSRMLSDLLKMFEDASAGLSDKNLKIEVNFDELENEFSFDLNHFREAERKTSVIRRNTEYVFCANPWLMMQYITKHTGPFRSMDFELRKDAAEWIEIYDSDVWPDFFPEAPVTGDEEFDII